MKVHRLVLAALGLLAAVSSATAGEAKGITDNSKMEHPADAVTRVGPDGYTLVAEGSKPTKGAFVDGGPTAAPDSDTEQAKPLPRVLLIGDSIREGYQEVVKQQLAGKANVAAIPCNGEYTGTGLKKLDEWLGDGKWDVIHFNWGLWDLYGWEYAKEDRSPAMYEKRLESLVLRLEKTGAKLIWATTTPACPEAEATMLKRFKTELKISRATERKYLDAALRVMNKHHIQIDDLHTLMLPELNKHAAGPDDVHFTGAGYGLLGNQVAASILAALAATPDKQGRFEETSVKVLLEIGKERETDASVPSPK